jgi:transcription antitermination factor NusG
MVFSHENELKQAVFAPFTVSSATLLSLQELATNHAPPTEVPLWQELLGKRIRIPRGPFMGYQAKIKSIDSQTLVVKLRLCSDILGQPAFLSMNLSDLATTAPQGSTVPGCHL